MIRTVLASTLIAAIALSSAAQAAPLKFDFSEYKAYDRWVDIFRRGDLVGPEIDPNNPLRVDVVEFDPQPEPPKVDLEVEVVIVKR
jgi:hypothetical protein